MSKRSYVQDLIGIWQFCFSGWGGGGGGDWRTHRKKKNFSQQARETKGRFRATFTANGKLQIQVENFSRIENEQIKQSKANFINKTNIKLLTFV